MPTLSPTCPLPSGTVFFHQAHALRWLGSKDNNPQRLWTEILAHALFFRHLLITDSQAVQNWALLNLLPSGRFWRQFEGLHQLLSEGAVIVAKRRGKSLPEILNDQMRGESLEEKVPVLVDGELRPIDENFKPLVDVLASALKPSHTYDFSLEQIRLADRFMEELDPQTGSAPDYGLDGPTRDYIGKLVAQNQSQGVVNARLLFWRPHLEKKEAPLVYRVQRFVTSVHSCNFPIAFNLRPTMSRYCDDVTGASALLHKRARPARAPQTPDPPPLEPRPEGLVVRQRTARTLVREGVKPILRLRKRREFGALQDAREAYLVEGVPGHGEALRRLDDAFIAYAARVLQEYRIPVDHSLKDHLANARLEQRYAESEFRSRKWVTDAQAAGLLGVGGVASLVILNVIQRLSDLGIPSWVIVTALLAPAPAWRWEQWRGERERERILAAAQVVNLAGAEQHAEVGEQPGPGA